MKIKFSVLLLVLPIVLKAQNDEIKFHPYFSAIYVRNIDASINWYKDVLGFSLRNRTDSPERGFRQANLVKENALLELVELNVMIPYDSALKGRPRGSAIIGFSKVGFSVPDIQAAYHALKAKSVSFVGGIVEDPFSKKKCFIIKDCDDNFIQFFER